MFVLVAFGCSFVAAGAKADAANDSVHVDRVTCFVPSSADVDRDTASPASSQRMRLPTQWLTRQRDPAWNAYLALWQAHYQDPALMLLRRYLGLPTKNEFAARSRPGTGAPRQLGWRKGTFHIVETPHFQIYSRASGVETESIARDLERCYWVWTQAFFPLWEGAAQVRVTLDPATEDDSVSADRVITWESVLTRLAETRGRLTVKRRLRVALFQDRGEYQSTLAKQVPGIEQSTG
ncbi:MAG: hypothetical protein AAGA03_11615, partial [Planctomycetota bacterium]